MKEGQPIFNFLDGVALGSIRTVAVGLSSKFAHDEERLEMNGDLAAKTIGALLSDGGLYWLFEGTNGYGAEAVTLASVVLIINSILHYGRTRNR